MSTIFGLPGATQVRRRGHPLSAGFVQGLAVAALSLLLAACSSGPSLNRAPVEDRGASSSNQAPVAIAQPVPVTGPIPAPISAAEARLPGQENAGKPGYYTVRPGDTLLRISLDHGQRLRDVVAWNLLPNPNQIEVGQVLRVAPPTGAVVAVAPAGAAAPAASAPSAVVARPAPQGNAQTAPVQPVGSPSQPAATAGSTASAPVAAAPAAAPAPAAANPDEDVPWMWPADGAVIAGFDEVKNKGIAIGGTAGAPVLAAADGRVVYVGSGLRGYGNLIILKHNNTYLTAYAHNQALLVKEDQNVRRGQKIAEMGNSDADRVKLHFELRRQGKPVDPAKYLPPK